MEDLLGNEHFAGLDVVIRTGGSANPASLIIAGADRAKTVVILNPTLDSGSKDGAGDDNEVLKSLLALRLVVQKSAHVVCELAGKSQLVILKTILPCRLDHVIMSETLARLLVQTCRVRGLSDVLADLLTFEGSELYFGDFPSSLHGLKFGDLQERVYDAVVVGFSLNDRVFLNPASGTILAGQEKLLILSESGTSWKVGEPRPMKASSRKFQLSRKSKREVVCIVGTSSSLEFIVKVKKRKERFTKMTISFPGIRLLF